MAKGRTGDKSWLVRQRMPMAPSWVGTLCGVEPGPRHWGHGSGGLGAAGGGGSSGVLYTLHPHITASTHTTTATHTGEAGVC